jgi:hypothetical protein
MNARYVLFLGLLSSLTPGLEVFAADETVATVVYSKTGNGYKRDQAKNGTFKPEYYALSNGGRIAGTTSDLTIDRVPYEEVAQTAMKLLAQQNYRYAENAAQAKLLLVLNWGGTLIPDWDRKVANAALAQKERVNFQRTKDDLQSMLDRSEALPSYPGEKRVDNTAAGLGRSIQFATNEEAAVMNARGTTINSIENSLTDDRARDRLNEANARVLGYMDELADSNDIRRYAGGGDRYSDLINEVEEPRYYIVISAYDFVELTKKQNKKLLWQTRVSVRGPGNAFDSSLLPMLKSASKYFGQNSGRLVRSTETKGAVKFGELKYIGEAKDPAADTAAPATPAATAETAAPAESTKAGKRAKKK